MKLTFLGGADEVGASCTLIEIAGKQILVDAGIRISPRSNRGIQNSQLPDLQPISAKGGPDYILVTHAHTDHTGALPLVVEQYPNVPVIATRPTQALVEVLQKDAQRIMKSRHEQEGELPLFDEIAVDRLLNAFQTVEFDQPLRLGDGLQVTYKVSGHIAGAAMLVLESEDGTLVMSGDLSKAPQRTVRSVDVPRLKADALVLESTYGGKLHANRDAEEKRLIDTLKRVSERGGKVLIPAFALGRAQEIVQIILAYRDEIDVPVYVDGMVRSVCDAYARFADLLPESTVRSAKDDHLFFRKKVKPVRSARQRGEIAMSNSPMVVVASSGMLTGGASVAYAKAFAGDERNAILLTGYQDEEAPGRFLQRIQKQREEGEIPTVKFDDTVVKIRCEVGTYSLSAHADESELVSIAEALKAEEIMLVHGDPGARHSLATALRQRQKVVTTPKIGQTRSLSFRNRPWAVGQVQSGHESGDVDLGKLWTSLKSHAGSFFSASELAQVWWGNASRADEILSALNSPVNLYFSANWRDRKTFQVRSEEQVFRAQRQRAIMLANPDLVGKLIVMRNSNNQPRLAVVRSADIDSFTAQAQNTKGTHFPADALLWVIGNWQLYEPDKSVKAQLSAMMKDAKAIKDTLLPLRIRQQLVIEATPILPENLIPDTLPDSVDRCLALVAIVLRLAEDGATLEQDGLLPQRALSHEPVEQNTAREIALSSFPPEARLRKVGLDIHRKRLILNFDFPTTAPTLYAQQIEQVMEHTGWDVHLNQAVNQQALGIAIDDLLPDGVEIIKGPSFHMARGEVQVQLAGIDDTSDLRREYVSLTGYRLVTDETQIETDSLAATISVPHGDQMEINTAYAHIRAALANYGLYKTSLKQGQIVLTFISPQVGERHQERIARLAEETGYGLSIHPHPNQQQILQIATRLINGAGWAVRKGPGIHTDRAEIAVKLVEQPNEISIEQVSQQLEEHTGYRLRIG